MKNYTEYKTIRQAANAFAKSQVWNRATKMIVGEAPAPEIGERKQFGYRKHTTGEYVPKSYLSNFGWKNTYYQSAVSEVVVPIEWYLWHGWRI